MLNFSEQCMDMARSILGKNIGAINEDGSITPVENESSLDYEPGHAALALGEFYRATGLTEIEGRDIVDLCARCITAQTNDKEYTEDGLAYSSLGLLSFGPSKDRNAVWDRLLEETQKNLDKRLLSRTDYDDHFQIFNILGGAGQNQCIGPDDGLEVPAVHVHVAINYVEHYIFNVTGVF